MARVGRCNVKVGSGDVLPGVRVGGAREGWGRLCMLTRSIVHRHNGPSSEAGPLVCGAIVFLWHRLIGQHVLTQCALQQPPHGGEQQLSACVEICGCWLPARVRSIRRRHNGRRRRAWYALVRG